MSLGKWICQLVKFHSHLSFILQDEVLYLFVHPTFLIPWLKRGTCNVIMVSVRPSVCSCLHISYLQLFWNWHKGIPDANQGKQSSKLQLLRNRWIYNLMKLSQILYYIMPFVHPLFCFSMWMPWITYSFFFIVTRNVSSY